ncbi:hypothetical protein RGQ21_45200 [Kitasatospora aureofaciens]|nr:hypothetical protein RGQ21_45200 [Kitasatospora aureofaciens]
METGSRATVGAGRYAAVEPAAELPEPEDEPEPEEDPESEDDEEAEDEAAFEDDAGELLDELPRLSLR